MVPPAIQYAAGDPRRRYREWQATSCNATESLLCVHFDLPSSWLDGAPPVSLTALYLRRAGSLEVGVLKGRPTASGLLPGAQFDAWVADRRLFPARAGRPLPLCPLGVRKPWGREIWFTGAERRGVCEFGVGEARTPQPWLLAALPGDDAGAAYRPLPLLKILDPLPEPVTGDLYFELHDVKQEVYIVTHVDRQVWPDGVGYLRFGFCPRRLAASESEAAFRRDYLASVRDYRRIRERIDGLPRGAALEPALREREVSLRTAMDAFTRLRPVEEGDVIEVPRLLPHALQHGVRVVEFQTPVFERRILSFAQRVLTQTHWDTEEAVHDMRLLPPPDRAIQTLVDEGGVRVEKIADLPDFEVRRIRVRPGSGLNLTVSDGQAVVMVLRGRLCLPDGVVGPEQGVWLPGGWRDHIQLAEDAAELVLLLALTRP